MKAMKGRTNQEGPSSSQATKRIPGPAKKGSKIRNPTNSKGIAR